MSRHPHLIVASVVCGLHATTAVVSAGERLIVEDMSMSRGETAALVTQDLAQRLEVRVDQLRLISASDRTWPDTNFGCRARKGLIEPTPIPGFAFTLAHGGRQYVYHTDREGHFRRCEAGKPVAPISR